MGSRDSELNASNEELERGERFLSAYNVIEQAMQRKMGDAAGKEGFRRLIDHLADRDWTVRKFREDLIEFAELRNAIVHERISPRYLIAVPLAGTLDRIERIAASIERPLLVYPRFRAEVVRFHEDDPVGKVLATLASTGYSQFPVYRERQYVGLLTDGGVGRWLARSLSDKRQAGAIGLPDLTVGEVMKAEKNPDRARFIARTATTYQAESLFAASGKDKWRISAVLITENGHPEEDLLGIITPSDILALNRE